jgi:hypothetical protein
MTTVTDGKASRPKPVKGPLASPINRPVETAGDLGTKGENSAEPTVNLATHATKWGTSHSSAVRVHKLTRSNHEVLKPLQTVRTGTKDPDRQAVRG